MKKLSIEEQVIEVNKLFKTFVGLPDNENTKKYIKFVINNYYNEMINSGYYTFGEMAEFFDKLSLWKAPSHEV